MSLAANIGLFMLGAPLTASASDHVIFVAGGQADFAGVGFIGATLALPGSSIGNGFAVRGAAFAGDYDYSSSAERRIKANFSGAELDGVYQLSRNTFWSNLALGARDVDTNLSPVDQNNRRRGRLTEFAASLDGGTVAGPWRAEWFGSYGTRLDDYAVRLSVTHALTSKARVGPEVSFEGDPTYGLHRIGPYVGLRLDKRSEVQVSAGVSHELGRNPGSYLRASIYRNF